MTDVELKELKESSIYVAGFTDPAVKRLGGLYDIFINGTHKDELHRHELQNTSLHSTIPHCTALHTELILHTFVVSEKSLVIADHAQEDFSGTSPLHKDISAFLVQALDNSAISDQNIVKQITVKTNSLLQKLDALKETSESGESYITLDTLQQQGLPPGMDRFLFSVAAAEGLAKTL